MVLKNINLVRSIINKKYLSKNPELYEDMMQEGIIGLIKAEKTFNENKGFKFTTYAYKVINNQILMYLKKYKNKHSGTLYYDEVSYKVDDGTSYLDILSDEPQKEYIDLYDAIKSLKPKHREIIYQVYFKDMAYRDAGEVSGMSRQGIHKRLTVALKQLREILGDKYENLN